MKKYAAMAIIALLVASCNLSAQDNNRQRRQDDTREQRAVVVQRAVVQEPRQEQAREQQPQQQRGQGGMGGAFGRVTPQAQAEAMGQQLELTEAQVTQVAALLERQEAQLREQLQERQGNPEELRTLRQQVMETHDTELGRIIGAEKLAQWQALRGERMRGAGGGGPR